jgi:hypothetical protein
MKTVIEMALEAGIEFQRITGLLGKETVSTCGSQRIEKIERLIELIRADEREACAHLAQMTVCDVHIPTGTKIYGTAAAKAIRARGNT